MDVETLLLDVKKLGERVSALKGFDCDRGGNENIIDYAFFSVIRL